MPSPERKAMRHRAVFVRSMRRFRQAACHWILCHPWHTRARKPVGVQGRSIQSPMMLALSM